MKNASHIIMIWHALLLVLEGSDIKIALYCLWNRGSQEEPGITNIFKILLREIHFEKLSLIFWKLINKSYLYIQVLNPFPNVCRLDMEVDLLQLIKQTHFLSLTYNRSVIYEYWNRHTSLFS